MQCLDARAVKDTLKYRRDPGYIANVNRYIAKAFISKCR